MTLSETEREFGATANSAQLAAAYTASHILTPEYNDNARHVAVCTVAHIEY